VGPNAESCLDRVAVTLQAARENALLSASADWIAFESNLNRQT
jgi:hypothetical protein